VCLIVSINTQSRPVTSNSKASTLAQPSTHNGDDSWTADGRLRKLLTLISYTIGCWLLGRWHEYPVSKCSTSLRNGVFSLDITVSRGRIASRYPVLPMKTFNCLTEYGLRSTSPRVQIGFCPCSRGAKWVFVDVCVSRAQSIIKQVFLHTDTFAMLMNVVSLGSRIQGSFRPKSPESFSNN